MIISIQVPASLHVQSQANLGLVSNHEWNRRNLTYKKLEWTPFLLKRAYIKSVLADRYAVKTGRDLSVLKACKVNQTHASPTVNPINSNVSWGYHVQQKVRSPMSWGAHIDARDDVDMAVSWPWGLACRPARNKIVLANLGRPNLGPMLTIVGLLTRVKLDLGLPFQSYLM